MAHLPSSKDGTTWMITEVGDDVCIISDPGWDSETVHWRYNGKSQKQLVKAKDEVFMSNKLTTEQKFYTSFWMGYFYAHMR